MKKLFVFTFTLCILTLPAFLFADTLYTSLAPIPGKVDTSITINESTLSTYLNNLYILGIMICSGLAVLMIVIGGVQWASSDAWSKKSEGKDRIWSAVIGLVIALGSFVILNTIDTNLVDIKLEWGEDIVSEAILLPRPLTGAGTDKPANYNPANPGIYGTGNTLQGSTFTDPALYAYALELVNNSTLPNLSPADAETYFPGGVVTPEGWVNLLAGITAKESNFNPSLTYTESFTNSKGERVISTGLMQISYESASGYGFPGITTDQLKDPYTNLQVGVEIMEKWVQQDGVISGKTSSGEYRGGARYWSTLR